jgi:Fe-S-cluster formation regulator IscX/YfhJ
MLASMYLEDLGLAERSIEILDRMIESSVEFQLNPREIFMLELNRAVVWLRMIQDNPNGSQELIADAVQAFDRLRTRGDSLELTIDVSHLLTYSRALCADIEAKLKKTSDD